MLIQSHENQNLSEKYWGGCDQKWARSLQSQDSKTGCISRRNQWNKLIFLHADTDSVKQKVTLVIIDGAKSKMC